MGIVLLVKNDFAHYVKVDNTSLSKLILWFSVSHEILNLDNDIDFGVTLHIPPHGSKFASDDPYMELQREILRRCPSSDQIVLMGAFNSRVGEKDDFCLVDEHLRNEFGLLEDESYELANRFAQRNISLKRFNSDKNTNYCGNQMIEFCQATNSLILNGRIGDNAQDSMFTCKDKSTIDYFLSTPSLFDIVTNLKVLEFNPLFSDVHCTVSVSIGITDTIQPCEVKKKTTVEEKSNLWDSEKSNIFVQNFYSKALSEIGDMLSALANKETIKPEDIEFIVNDIGKLFSDTAEISFGKKRISNDKKTKNIKQWFNAECRRARNQYH